MENRETHCRRTVDAVGDPAMPPAHRQPRVPLSTPPLCSARPSYLWSRRSLLNISSARGTENQETHHRRLAPCLMRITSHEHRRPRPPLPSARARHICAAEEDCWRSAAYAIRRTGKTHRRRLIASREHRRPHHPLASARPSYPCCIRRLLNISSVRGTEKRKTHRRRPPCLARIVRRGHLCAARARLICATEEACGT